MGLERCFGTTNGPQANLYELTTHEVPMELSGAIVQDMWEQDSGWKWESFAPYLSQDTLKQIQAFALRIDDSVGDLVYWQGPSQCKFSIKPALTLMRHETDCIDDECWEIIWKTPIQQRA